MNTKLYEVKRGNLLANGTYEWKVVRKSDHVNVFFGTRTECNEWIERNGHDDWN